MKTDRPARTRVAPSPTGDPHVGTAYQALFNKALAESTGGAFVLRIEDTDRERSSLDSERMIFRALRWLGLDWSEGPDVDGPHGPYRQSERGEIYRQHAQLLLDHGVAYRCFSTPEELAALRAARDAGEPGPRPDRVHRELSREESDERARSQPHVLRLAVPLDGTTVVHDELRGDVPFKNELLDDQVLLKSDGFPTYHLANVVDDHLMGITHVIRGEEWLSSTAKHVLLYRAFGWEQPLWLHTPLLRNPDKSKLSKRKNPTSLDWYRSEGFLPEAMLNFLATLAWSHPEGEEFFPYEEFKTRFDGSQMSLSGPIFDIQKLLHLNGLWIRSLPVPELTDRLLAGGHVRHADAPRERLEGAVALVQERLERLSEFDGRTAFFFEDPALDDAGGLVGKKATPEGVRAFLESLTEGLSGAAEWTNESVEGVTRGVADSADLKRKDAFMAARVAVTGTPVSTPLFETLALLGRETTLRRLRAAAELLPPSAAD